MRALTLSRVREARVPVGREARRGEHLHAGQGGVMREARVHGRIGRYEIEREIVSKSEAIRGNQARVH